MALEVYNGGNNGEVSGSTSAKQLPDVPCRMAIIQAAPDNAGNVYLGFSSSVTKPNGTTDLTTGIGLDAGVMTNWITVDNLNKLYIICDNAGDDILYLTLG